MQPQASSSSSIRLFIVRHAEHVAPSETSLSKVGSLQAAALAEMFKSTKSQFDRMYTSPRCMETAETIAQAVNVQVEVDERLRNWHGGLLTGLTKAQIRDQHPELHLKRFVDRDPKFKVPEGESLQERYNRVEQFLLDQIQMSNGQRQVIVVTHGGVIDDMFRITCGLEPIQRIKLNKPFGCLSVLTHSMTTGWRNEQWAKADHLPRVVAESPTGGSLYLFPNQVSGSFPMLRGDRGELCKPATPNELACYRVLFAEPAVSREIAALRDCVPKFLGTVDVDVSSIIHGENDTITAASVEEEFSTLSLVQEEEGNEGDTPLLTQSNTATLAASTSQGIRRASSVSTMPASSSNPVNFSVSNLWRRFVTDRWTKMVRASDGKRCVYLILENMTHGLGHPNIMDVKVGTR
ncbi:hypothetical protein BASA81_006415 [Batrachochytrium salamandrivorans]|nr:hypothetical protein BASA81_006415 [Batrachochytrium salamandrivorans]